MLSLKLASSSILIEEDANFKLNIHSNEDIIYVDNNGNVFI